MTSITLLEQLRSSSSLKLGAFVQEAIVTHGIYITKLQRLMRIHNALHHGKVKNLQEELENSGHENWSPLERPDWLLLEIDSAILIRQEQVDVANAIIAPASRENTVLQLNMGKGQSIAPYTQGPLTINTRQDILYCSHGNSSDRRQQAAVASHCSEAIAIANRANDSVAIGRPSWS
jgi:hypothetical protein